MKKIYEIKKYNQKPDADEQFLDDKFPIFHKIEEVENYLKENSTYGKVFEYDKEEYNNYYNASEADSYYLDVPEPINEWVTDDLTQQKVMILQLIKQCRNSSFNKNSYEVNIDMHTFVDSMLLHTWYDFVKNKESKERIALDDKKFNTAWIERVTPEFQRDNNKWNKAMKLRFIENLLSGVKVELMFFRLNNNDDAQIIDGLQRTTAILDFFHGKVKPFGYTYQDLKKHFFKFRSNNITIKIYTFDTWQEVGKFYIDMNENITHSKADIQKAKDWFLAEHNIEL